MGGNLNKMKKIALTGGAGYIGSVLARLLINKGYELTVIDNLEYGGNALIDMFNSEKFSFIKIDLTNKNELTNLNLENFDAVVHLAAIVGDPACKLYPEKAKSLNEDASKNLYELSEKYKVKKFIFASTCSNYGKMKDPDSYVNENSELSPISLYAETKVNVEKFLLNQKHNNYCKPTVLRFSTVYGLSMRPRFDLTVNEFTKDIVTGKELTVFGENFWRPYCHVFDLARSVEHVINSENENINFNVFNVGSTSENYTKKMIVDEILSQFPEGKVKYIHKDEDPRDYKVNFDKIKTVLNFEPVFKVKDGISQIISVVTNNIISDLDDKRFKNI